MSSIFVEQKQLARRSQAGAVWKALKPYRIVSLLEMLEHHAKIFYYTTNKLCELQSQIAKAIEERGSNALPTIAEASLTRILIRSVGREAERLNFTNILRRLLKFNVDDELLQPPTSRHPFTLIRLQMQLEELYDDVAGELGQNGFMMIPTDKLQYYNDKPQFGEKVAAKFSKAITDIQEAGKCYATGRYTATVFHLMRVMEYATQYLGRRLSISLVNEKNWQNIVDEVDKAIKNLPTKDPRQKALRNRFAEASAHLRMVKNAWRNDVMHPKETYTEQEAERVLRNVNDFMVHIAIKL
jgi:HEPN domain-containing protein